MDTTDPYKNIATVANPTTFGGSLGFGSSGASLSSGARERNELADVRNQLNSSGQLTPQEQQILNANYNDQTFGQLTPDQLLQRYQTIGSSKNDLFKQWIAKAGSSSDQMQYQAYATMADLLGRVPTSDEFTQLLPTFQGPNGTVNGRAAVSNYTQGIKNDPNNPNSSLNPNNAGYADRLKPFNDQVGQQFQSIMGRAATGDELNHFASILASGQTDAYGLQNFLKQQPEYTNAQDAQFRSGLNTELQGYDTQEFNREKGDVEADYAKRGFTPGNSPSLDYAMTDLMGKMAQNRQAYLSQLSAQQYGGNKQLAEGNYQNSLNQMYEQNQQNRQRQNQLTDYYTQRGNQGADYQTQMNDFLNFQRSQRGRGTNPLYGAVGGMIGAGIGSVGGPAGAGVGYQVGQGAGNAFGYLNT